MCNILPELMVSSLSMNPKLKILMASSSSMSRCCASVTLGVGGYTCTQRENAFHSPTDRKRAAARFLLNHLHRHALILGH